LLCLPSLTGGAAIIANSVLQRHIEEWDLVSSLSIALAVFVGAPLVWVAAVVSTLVGLRPDIPQEVMYIHYVIVGLATIATFSLTFHFGIR
ncbi:MAG TPA: hypothetical protein VK466_04125, partial [Terriglobales bacterium]|nr:hypothetical protein [Terriglobales bacterium]